MRVVLALVLVAAACAVAACGESSSDVNEKCRPYGGVLSTDDYNKSYVCADHRMRPY